tara:strand:- start:18 stop:221 length:204 start_codon:yes stop_codon:yes gene_type:complete
MRSSSFFFLCDWFEEKNFEARGEFFFLKISLGFTYFLAPPLLSRKNIFKDDDFYTMEFSSRIYTYCV